MKLVSILIILSFILISPCYSFSANDCKIVISENSLDRVVKETIKGDKLSSPGLELYNDKFNFKITYSHWLAGKQRFEFIGFIRVTDNSDVIIAIADHKRNGDSESTSTTRDRVKDLVGTINGNDNKTMYAKFIEKYSHAKCAIKLKTGNLTLMPSLSNVKIKDIKIKDKCIELATCKEHSNMNTGADIQAFVGENILNALLKKFSSTTEKANIKINEMKIDLSKENSVLSFDVNNNGKKGDCSFKTKSNVPDLNKVELSVNDAKANGDFSSNELINTAIDIINAKIRNEKSKVRGKKLQFKYENGKIKFEANLDDVIPLKIRPGVFKIDTTNTYITINAQMI